MILYAKRMWRRVRLPNINFKFNFKFRNPYGENGINIRELVDRYKYPGIYILGILIGTIIFNVLRYKYEAELISYGKYLFSSINGIESEQSQFVPVLLQRLKELVICIIMIFTPFSRFYGMFTAFRYGVSISVTLSMAIACYESMGIVIFLMSVLPYGILLILAAYLMIKLLENKELNIKNVLVIILIIMVEALLES